MTEKSKLRKRIQRRALNKKTAFLKAYAICANLTESAASIGVDRSLHYEWLKNDPKYPAAFADAYEQAAQSLEDEAVTRANRGVFEPLIYKGQFSYPQEVYEITPADPGGVWDPHAGEVTRPTPAVLGERDVPGAPPLGTWKKSDGLMQYVLRGFLPAKYRQGEKLEITGAGGGPIELGIVERLNAGRARVAALGRDTAPAE